MNINQSLEIQRQLASEISGGISDDPIYRAFEHQLVQLNLSGNLLDFGAGVGNLSQRLHKSGRFSSITAIDIMQRPINIHSSIEWIRWDLNQTTKIPSATFDVIISAEVIEHLENPRVTIREWFRLLRSGGTLIFSTPNNESWRSILALLIQGHFVAFGDNSYPAHITALLRKDIEHILYENGFSQPNFIFTDFGRIPKLVKWNWQTISGGILKGLRYSDNLLVTAKKLS